MTRISEQSQTSLRKLRIGQRGKGRDGWVHLDGHPSADIVATIPPLPSQVTERRWDVIEGIHVWEHFYKWDAERLAADLNRILVPGGSLVLECPNLEVACRAFLNRHTSTPGMDMHVFYGDPNHKDPSYTHRWGYTPQSLRQQLIEYGGFAFEDILIEPALYHVPIRDFRIVAVKR